MKKTNKLWLALLLTVLVAALLAVGFTAAAEEPAVIDQGTCGQNLTWVLTDDGTLTISGTGRMSDYSRNQVPWRSNRSLIQSVVIENGVRNIGSFTFEYSSNLTSVTMPNSIERIGSHAFATCVNLKNVEIPNGVTRIDYDAFASCGLLSVEIPDSVITIYDYAFADCRKMKTLILGSNLQTIELTAFVNCEALEDVVLPDSLLTLGSSAFTNCSSLTSFTVPAGVTNIKGNPVKLCKNLTSIEAAPGNPIYHSAGNCLIKTETGAIIFGCQTSVIPSDGSVTSINYGAFYGTQGLTRLKIPVSVTSIGAEAFGQCEFLQDVYYSGSEEQWNAMTIVEEGNAPLLNANIHFNVVDWGYCGGEGDGTNLTWVLTSDGTLTISGQGAMKHMDTMVILPPWYENAHDIKELRIDEGVTTIGSCAFCYVQSDDVYLPDGITTIEGYAFAGCSVKNIRIPDSVTSIGGSAFSTSFLTVYFAGTEEQWEQISVDDHNWMLERATIYYNVADWGYCGGEGDGTNVRWVLDNDGTLTISGEGAMANYHPRRTPWYAYTSSIKSVVAEDGVSSIGSSSFWSCGELASVALPDTLQHIGSEGFMHCLKLTEITLPADLRTIGPDALYNTGLSAITIPSSLERLGSNAVGSIDTVVLLCKNFTFYTDIEPFWNATIYGYADSEATMALAQFCTTCQFVPLCPVDYTHTVADKTEIAATCAAAGHTAGWYCEDCGVWLSGEEINPLNHRNAYEVAATEATATAHGHTAGVWCPDCDTWLSGEVVHNALGAQTVIQAPTETEEGLVDIVCTVCGETFRYTAEKLPHTDPQPEQPEHPIGTGDTGSGFWARIQTAFRGFIDWFLRLFRFFG